MMTTLHFCTLCNVFTAPVHTAKYHNLFEEHKEFEYQTETDLLNRLGS